MSGEDRDALAIVSWLNGRRRLGDIQGAANACQFGDAADVCQKTEVTNATEALRQDVEEEPADKLIGLERHHFTLAVGAIISPVEADAAILAGEQTAVADCDAMGVAAEIIEDSLRAGEGAFGIDHPFDIAELRLSRAKVAGSCRPMRVPKKFSLPRSNAACRHCRNKRRYSRERTRTGWKKSSRQPIQQPPGVRPPPGTRQ